MHSVFCIALKIYTTSTLYKQNLISLSCKEAIVYMLVWKVGIIRHTNHLLYNVFQCMNFDTGTKVFLTNSDSDKYILLGTNLIKILLNQCPNAETWA